jgi:hypothetical protein
MNSGEMDEWFKSHAWKACLRAIVTGVRIPLSPPNEKRPARGVWHLAEKSKAPAGFAGGFEAIRLQANRRPARKDTTEGSAMSVGESPFLRQNEYP